MKNFVTCVLLAAGVAAGSASAHHLHLPAPADTLASTPTTPIQTVTVRSSRYRHDVRHLPMRVSTLERPAIERAHNPSLLPTLNEQTAGLFSTARGIMGYGVSGGAAGQISIRGIGGAPTTGVMVLVDGHPQYMGIMGHPIADACNSLSAERVEVLRGPASVLYGSNAMGGVINIVTRQSAEEGVNADLNAGYGSYNTLQSELTLHGKYRRLTASAGASYNRTDGHRRNMGFAQTSAFAKAACDIGRAWAVRAEFNMTCFDASQPGSLTSPLEDADQHVARYAAAVAVENSYAAASGALSLFYNWGRHRIDDGHAPTEAPRDYLFHSRDNTLGISAFENIALWRGARLTAGVEWQRYGGRKWNLRTEGERRGEKYALLDRTMHSVAGYASLRQHIGSWLTLDAGLRVDHNSRTGTECVPQAGAVVHLTHGIEVKASAGKGFRTPTIREMYMVPQRNDALRPERLWSYEASFSQNLLAGRLSYGMTLYYINGDNMIIVVPREGTTPRFENSGRIENCGVEAEVGWQIAAAWRVDANYSYLHMEHPVIAAPEHKFYVGGSFIKGRWSLSTGVQYIAGLYTAVGEAPRTESFVLWNLRGAVRVARWLSVWARGENLLAQRYEINAGYPMPRATALVGVTLRFGSGAPKQRGKG